MYAQIAFATLAAWIAFGNAPDVWTVPGIGLFAVFGVFGLSARRACRTHSEEQRTSMDAGVG
jgi:hypothetical protein